MGHVHVPSGSSASLSVPPCGPALVIWCFPGDLLLPQLLKISVQKQGEGRSGVRWCTEPSLASSSRVTSDGGRLLSLMLMWGQDNLGTRQGSEIVRAVSWWRGMAQVLAMLAVPRPRALVAQGCAVVSSLSLHGVMAADGYWPPFLPELQRSCVTVWTPGSTPWFSNRVWAGGSVKVLGRGAGSRAHSVCSVTW